MTAPVAEGLEPEARADLKPARPEPAAGSQSGRRYGRIAAGVLVAWVLILGIIVGIGELITKAGHGNVLGDRTIPRWFAAHRTPGLTRWSEIFSTLGATQAILIVALVTCVVFLAVTRHWRPVVFIAAVMAGELGAFLVAAAVVRRPRPDVTQLDRHLPTSAYPSGHEAATCCLYVAIAILVIGHARGWWRWLFLVPAIAMPVLVAISRMYRGEHHPTDILGSLLFAALWLTATSALIKPGADRQARRQEAAAGNERGHPVRSRPGSTPTGRSAKRRALPSRGSCRPAGDEGDGHGASLPRARSPRSWPQRLLRRAGAARCRLLVVRCPDGLTQVTEIVSPGWNRDKMPLRSSGEPTALPVHRRDDCSAGQAGQAAGLPQIVPMIRVARADRRDGRRHGQVGVAGVAPRGATVAPEAAVLLLLLL